jgi:hypothetical protein
VPHTAISAPKPNLLYDRMFSFYDTNNDGMIGFEEFLKGVACVHSKGQANNKLRKVFDGYDIDGDGFVSRKDFLRIFRAYYAIQKEITHDLLAVQEEELMVMNSMEAIMTSQPLSAVFTEPIMSQSDRGPPDSKLADQYGERRSNFSAIRETSEDVGNHEEVVGNPWRQSTGDTGQALRERWRRREFYTDEEEGFSIQEPNGPQSPTDSEHIESETAGASDSSQFPEAEKDFGREILYQVTQQGLNELLDAIFKEKEDLALEVEQTKDERGRWIIEIGDLALQVLAASKSENEATLSEYRNGSIEYVPGAKLALPTPAVTEVEAHVQGQTLESPLDETSTSVADGSAIEAVLAAESLSVQTPNGGPVVGSTSEANVPQPLAIESRRSERAAVPTENATVTSTLDQTMPQNRPNSDADLARLIITKLDESRSLGQFSTGDNGEFANPGTNEAHNMDQLVQFMFSEASTKEGSTAAQKPWANVDLKSKERPSPDRLAELLRLQLAEGQIKRTGGLGRLSFSEFEKLMNSEEGKSFAFVEGWFELGSF